MALYLSALCPAVRSVIIFIACQFWLFAPLRIVFAVVLVCVTCTLLSHLDFVYANFCSARSLCCQCFCNAYRFVLHAALAIGASQMFVDLFRMLLLPSGLCRCLFICLHAALAIGALQMLFVLFACCSCHRGFADACYLFCMLLLPSGLCRCLLICFACCSCHRGFADAY